MTPRAGGFLLAAGTMAATLVLGPGEAGEILGGSSPARAERATSSIHSLPASIPSGPGQMAQGEPLGSGRWR